MGEQAREHPEGFWSPGLQDYLDFADRIRKDFAEELQGLEAGDDVPAHVLSNGKSHVQHVVQLLLSAGAASVTALEAGEDTIPEVVSRPWG